MISVVNKYHTHEGEYIGRGNPLGNQWSHMDGTQAKFKVATREEAIMFYRAWLPAQVLGKNEAVIRELERLLALAIQGDLELKCYCAPKACHGDVVKEFLEYQLKKIPIFVFGSNLQGSHGAGAAQTARVHHGAVNGVAEGLMGTCYALPTCDRWDNSRRRFPALHLEEVKEHVEKFIAYARTRPELVFKVTRVGCGLAGLTDEYIAPMFKDAPDNCTFDTIWQKYLPSKRFWGTY